MKRTGKSRRVSLTLDDKTYNKLVELISSGGQHRYRSIPNIIAYMLHRHLDMCEKGTYHSTMTEVIDESILVTINYLNKFKENLQYVRPPEKKGQLVSIAGGKQ